MPLRRCLAARTAERRRTRAGAGSSEIPTINARTTAPALDAVCPPMPNHERLRPFPNEGLAPPFPDIRPGRGAARPIRTGRSPLPGTQPTHDRCHVHPIFANGDRRPGCSGTRHVHRRFVREDGLTLSPRALRRRPCRLESHSCGESARPSARRWASRGAPGSRQVRHASRDTGHGPKEPWTVESEFRRIARRGGVFPPTATLGRARRLAIEARPLRLLPPAPSGWRRRGPDRAERTSRSAGGRHVPHLSTTTRLHPRRDRPGSRTKYTPRGNGCVGPLPDPFRFG